MGLLPAGFSQHAGAAASWLGLVRCAAGMARGRLCALLAHDEPRREQQCQCPNLRRREFGVGRRRGGGGIRQQELAQSSWLGCQRCIEAVVAAAKAKWADVDPQH